MTELLLPTALALPAALVLTALARRVSPALGMRLLAIGIASLFVTLFATSAMIGVGLAAHHPISDLFGWCRGAVPHGAAPTSAAAGFLGFTAWWSWRLGRVACAWYRHRGIGASRVHVVDAAEPVAFAQTGRHGGIVVSTGMLAMLDDAEQAVLFAHEQAHLDQRHDRYLAVAALGASIPPLIPAARALRHALERRADEFAAEAVGDRHLVARALAKVALTRHDRMALAASIAGSDLVARIDALATPRTPVRTSRARPALAVVALSAVVLGAVAQVHHSAEAVLRICSW